MSTTAPHAPAPATSATTVLTRAKQRKAADRTYGGTAIEKLIWESDHLAIRDNLPK
jgi:hypothetical protein